MWAEDTSIPKDLLLCDKAMSDATVPSRLFSSSSEGLLSPSAYDSMDGDNPKKGRCNIAKAKELLAEAVSQSQSSLARGGALGSLLSLMTSSEDIERIHECFESLSFLSLDKGNRRTLLDLSTSYYILRVMKELQLSDPSNTEIHLLGLRTLCNLVGASKDPLSPTERRKIWEEGEDVHPLITLILSPSINRQPSQLAEALSLVHRLAFVQEDSLDEGMTLLEPNLLSSVGNLLHPLTETSVMINALKILKSASTSALAKHLPLWTKILFRLVPLLISGSLVAVDTSLIIIMNLVYRSKRFRDAVFAAGCITALLSLVQKQHPMSQRIASSLILAALAESSSLGRQQLSKEVPLRCILKAMQQHQPQHKQSDKDSVILGLLLCLTQLATSSIENVVGTLLCQMGAVSVIESIADQSHDDDIALATAELLGTLSQGHKLLRGASFHDWGSDAKIFIQVPPHQKLNQCTPS